MRSATTHKGHSIHPMVMTALTSKRHPPRDTPPRQEPPRPERAPGDDAPETPPTEAPPVPVEEPPGGPEKDGPFVVHAQHC